MGHSIAGRANTLVVLARSTKRNEQIRNSGTDLSGFADAGGTSPLLGFNRGFGPDCASQRTVKVVTDTAAVYLEDIYEIAARLKVVGL